MAMGRSLSLSTRDASGSTDRDVVTVGDVEKNSIRRVLWKELRVAGLMALLLGSIATLDTLIINGLKDAPQTFELVSDIALAIGAAMVGHVLTAALLGACTPIVVKNLLDANIRLISGYPGGNDVLLAMERGEVDGRCGWSYSSLSSTRGDCL